MHTTYMQYTVLFMSSEVLQRTRNVTLVQSSFLFPPSDLFSLLSQTRGFDNSTFDSGEVDTSFPYHLTSYALLSTSYEATVQGTGYRTQD